MVAAPSVSITRRRPYPAFGLILFELGHRIELRRLRASPGPVSAPWT
ncbi:hypothetical protein [Massilia aerilata]|uniref:Uncharacterized protein n=1 Tax=Massilia aerilata TaxID=453817 RepID=A0ABW0RSJ2_9BURK